MPHYHIVLNARSGTALALGVTPQHLADRLEQAGYSFSMDFDEETSLEARIARALESKAEIIVAAGGDGTVSAVASAVTGTDKILAVLPLGTVNSLARDLGMPLTLDQWVAALDRMEPRRIDVGEVNGRIFLHMVVIGLIPSLAAGREHLRERKGVSAWIGLMRYFFRSLSRAQRLALHIAPEQGLASIARVHAIAVACNAYEEGFGRVLSRQTLDSGQLTLYVLKSLTLKDIVRLSTEMVLGRWQQDETLAISTVPAVTIRSHKPKLQAMLDGEIQSLQVPLAFTIRPGALNVLALSDQKVQGTTNSTAEA